jgi:hypothetical protein
LGIFAILFKKASSIDFNLRNKGLCVQRNSLYFKAKIYFFAKNLPAGRFFRRIPVILQDFHRL